MNLLAATLLGSVGVAFFSAVFMFSLAGIMQYPTRYSQEEDYDA
jgi:hypothetical protein